MKAESSREILEMIKDGRISSEEGFRRIKRLKNGNVQNAQSLDIAVIGMSGRFPGAGDLDEFWSNLMEGKSAVKEITRWDEKKYYDPDPQAPGKSYSKWGGFLDGIDRFDPLFFNISPREAVLMDPQQRLFLEEAWRSLEDAGYSNRALEGVKCGVFVGCAQGEYHTLAEENGLPPEAFTFMGNSVSILASRISYFLNLKGPSMAVDTACSSSLSAVHLACESILCGTSDMAIAGGVTIFTTPRIYILASKSGMLSPNGWCRSFDHRADGFVPGECVGAIVLKCLESAVRDGDHIYGVISGTGINQDGRTNGIAAPSALAQAALEQEIYERYGIDPEAIGYIEAHGTGTKLGDPIEMDALIQAFRKFTGRKQYCAVGSLKSNIGHSLAASGIAGLIKVLLCLKHKKIVPSINFEEGNPYIDFKESPFYVAVQPRDWEPLGGQPRQAAVNSFGFSGTNAHLVIREAPGPGAKAAPGDARPWYLVPLSAKTGAALQQKLEDLARWLERNREAHTLRHISHTLLAGRSHFPVRSAFIARDIRELQEGIRAVLDRGESGIYLAHTPDRAQPVQENALRELGDTLLERLQAPGIGEAAYKKDLAALADLYVKGYDFPWETLYLGEDCRRIPMPTYPFAGNRYWVPERTEPEEPLFTGDARAASAKDRACQYDLQKKIEDTLVAYTVQLLQISEEELDLEITIDQFGFDSLLFTRLAGLLNNQYNISMDLSVFYEQPTLRSLAGYLEKEFGDSIRRYYRDSTGGEEPGFEYETIDMEDWFQQMAGGEEAACDKDFTLLHRGEGKNIFAFPPLFGFGVAYLKLASLLEEFSFYSFDFIEGEDRIQRYASEITEIQKEGPYTLLGYSGGGLLAFDVAEELSRRGYKISGLIIIDSPSQFLQMPFNANLFSSPRLEDIIKLWGTVQTLLGTVVKPIVSGHVMSEEWLKNRVQFFEYWVSNALKVKDKFVRYVLQGKIAGYIMHMSSRKNHNGRIDADIHLIKSPEINDERINLWGSRTGRELKRYNGYGSHLEMISPGFVEKNAEIVKEILYEIG